MTSLSSLYHSNRKSRFFRCKFWVCFLIFLMCILPIFGSSTKIYANHIDSQISKVSQLNIGQDNDIVNEDSIIFEGNASALDITDYGNSYQLDQEVSVNNESETKLEYYLDSQHGWKASKIENKVSNIHDNRDWVQNGGLRPLISFQNGSKTYEDKWNDGGIDPEEDPDPTDPSNVHAKIYHPGAFALRAHFNKCRIATNYDYLFLWDENNTLCYTESNYTSDTRCDFYSPWILGDTIKMTLLTEYGYYPGEIQIDFYEFYNASSNFDINKNSWSMNNFTYNQTYFGYGNKNNTDGIFVSMNADINISAPYYVTYYEDEFVEVFQNLTVPRGNVIDGYISFDYLGEFIIDSNDFFIYLELNKEKVYSIGLADILDGGINTWQNTGKIYLDLWINNSNIFQQTVYDQKLNLSLGVKSRSTTSYGGFYNRFQQVIWFDNISLGLTTVANSTQNEIALSFDENLLDDKASWGQSSINLNQGWTSNPIILDINTTSPDLKFNLNNTIYGYHITNSKINQLGDQGSNYRVLSNGTIIREFYHNLYMPAEYQDFEFIIDKPENWKIISVQDPTLQSRTFENGDFGDTNLKVPKSQAIFPGWWKFVAESPNYLNLTKTKMLKDGQWVNSEFQSGDSTIIKTNISNQGEIPDLQNTNCSLKVYSPEGILWHNEKIQPNSTTGLVQFSRINFASQNTTGGVYEYSIFWSNGIDVGGVKSRFTINHNSSMAILKPEDIEGYKIEGYYGDIIPLRLYLTDIEKDIPISEALIYYNFTNNETYSFEEVLPGVYDTIIDTETFNGAGTYNISISTSKIGFFTNGMELQLSLRERIDSNPLILPLLIGSIGAASILGALSFRSYIWLPKKRKEEEELMAKTQKFKDLQNIQAVVVIHKLSGIPLYTQGYSILEKQKRELFSGFIQAITTISEEFSGSKLIKDNRAKKQYGIERLIELDFKYFYCLIADQDDLRVVLILKNKASERLKEQVSYLCNALILKLSELFDHWDGSLNEFEEKIPDIVEDYFELYYKGDFELTHPKKIAKSRNQENLTTMETRVLNVIYSLSKNKETTKLDYVMEIVSEQKKELIMLALEGLINRKIIVPAIIEEDKDQ